MLKNIIRKILKLKIVKYLIIFLFSPLIHVLYQVLFFVSIRSYSRCVTIKKSINKFTIGIAVYPHPHKDDGYNGGDSTVNILLKKIFEEQGYEVNCIKYDSNFLKNSTRLKRILAMLIGMPYIFSEKVNHVSSEYNVLLVDSCINFHINHPACINLFHYSFGGYRERVGCDWDALSHLIYIKLNIIQRFGSRKCINVAVSDFLKMILTENRISVDHVIYNSIDTEHFKPKRIELKSDYLYAGGFSYYGKGFDVLEKLAEKGLTIDCVTNCRVDKSRLNFLPIVSHDKMPAIYNKYKLLFYPSRFESCGMVSLEAMACGVPVIISEVGIGLILKKFIPEFVVSGYDNNAIKEYIRNTELVMMNYSYYSQKAREFIVSHFSYQTFKNSWCELMENIKYKENKGSGIAENIQ